MNQDNVLNSLPPFAKCFLIVICFVWMGCNEDKIWVEQRIRRSSMGERNLVTYVWQGNEIVQSWYDPLEIVNDSIIDLRKRQAADLVKMMEDNDIKVDN